jgi:hypothetical protein
VRIRTGDQLLLRERAAARGMACATYVSVLVRSHLRAVAPLPKDELIALKRAVGELGAVGRNLNQITRAMNPGRPHCRPWALSVRSYPENLRGVARSHEEPDQVRCRELGQWEPAQTGSRPVTPRVGRVHWQLNFGRGALGATMG